MKILTFLLPLLGCFSFGFAAHATGTSDDELATVLPVAKAWMAMIDAGQYDLSYNSGGEALHRTVPEDKWTMILKTERPLMGKLVSRKISSHEYKPNGFEGTDGEFMLLIFDSSFEKIAEETEHVVLHREGGKWVGVGYNFGPRQVQPPEDDSNTTTSSSTTTSTPISSPTSTSSSPSSTPVPAPAQ